MIARLLCLMLVASPLVAGEEDDVADVPSQDLRVGKDEQQRYFLIGPKKGAEVPKAGLGLVVVMPGGPGTADFHPFVKRMWKNAFPDGYLIAQPVAVKWTDGQEIVWPTKLSPVEKMRFTTEEFVAGVIKDVGGKHKLDPKRVFTLSWSSSGPAAYAIALTDKTVKGSFVAMSVFKPDQLPPLEKVKGHAFFIHHSRDDAICPHRMAQQAARDLQEKGATTMLNEYDGGHGWKGALWDDIKLGIEWLEKNAGK